MIDLSKSKASVDIKAIEKTYELRFLRGNRLNVTQCTEEMLPDLLNQIIKDGHTVTKVNLV